MAKTIACSLNEVKDKDLIDYMDGMNRIGLNNAALIKVALYKIMGEGMDSLLSISTNSKSDKPSEEEPQDPKKIETTEETEEEVEEKNEEEMEIEKEIEEIKKSINIDESTNIELFKTKLAPVMTKR